MVSDLQLLVQCRAQSCISEISSRFTRNPLSMTLLQSSCMNSSSSVNVKGFGNGESSCLMWDSIVHFSCFIITFKWHNTHNPIYILMVEIYYYLQISITAWRVYTDCSELILCSMKVIRQNCTKQGCLRLNSSSKLFTFISQRQSRVQRLNFSGVASWVILLWIFGSDCWNNTQKGGIRCWVFPPKLCF